MADASDSTQDESGGQTVNQNVNVSIEQEDTSPSIIVRGVYFLLFGWWASGVWLSIAWILNLTIIGMPLGIKMINFVPKIVSLKDRKIETERTVDEDGNVTIKQGTSEQYSLPLRAAYFLLVGGGQVASGCSSRGWPPSPSSASPSQSGCTTDSRSSCPSTGTDAQGTSIAKHPQLVAIQWASISSMLNGSAHLIVEEDSVQNTRAVSVTTISYIQNLPD